MNIQVFSDSKREDKVAEVYDIDYACALLRGVLEKSRTDEKDVAITFVNRVDDPVKPFNE